MSVNFVLNCGFCCQLASIICHRAASICVDASHKKMCKSTLFLTQGFRLFHLYKNSLSFCLILQTAVCYHALKENYAFFSTLFF